MSSLLGSFLVSLSLGGRGKKKRKDSLSQLLGSEYIALVYPAMTIHLLQGRINLLNSTHVEYEYVNPEPAVVTSPLN